MHSSDVVFDSIIYSIIAMYCTQYKELTQQYSYVTFINLTVHTILVTALRAYCTPLVMMSNFSIHLKCMLSIIILRTHCKPDIISVVL